MVPLSELERQIRLLDRYSGQSMDWIFALLACLSLMSLWDGFGMRPQVGMAGSHMVRRETVRRGGQVQDLVWDLRRASVRDLQSPSTYR